jgi:hypothetical protein
MNRDWLLPLVVGVSTFLGVIIVSLMMLLDGWS